MRLQLGRRRNHSAVLWQQSRKDRSQTIIIPLQQRIILVVMTPRTLQTHTQKNLRR